MQKCKHKDMLEQITVIGGKQHHRQVLVQRATLVQECQECGQVFQFVISGGLIHGQVESRETEKG